jgi:hypothetical protein
MASCMPAGRWLDRLAAKIVSNSHHFDSARGKCLLKIHVLLDSSRIELQSGGVSGLVEPQSSASWAPFDHRESLAWTHCLSARYSAGKLSAYPSVQGIQMRRHQLEVEGRYLSTSSTAFSQSSRSHGQSNQSEAGARSIVTTYKFADSLIRNTLSLAPHIENSHLIPVDPFTSQTGRSWRPLQAIIHDAALQPRRAFSVCQIAPAHMHGYCRT